MPLLRRFRSLPTVLSIQLKIFLICLQEARTFFRFPRQIKISPVSRGRRVILYGIPYADWNATLGDHALWAQMTDIAQVLRLPANPFRSGARAGERYCHRHEDQPHQAPTRRTRPRADGTRYLDLRGQGEIRGLYGG
jgi:hypothetical protein